MKRDFDLIVFDWDGALMDSEAKIVRCMTAAALDAGIPDQGAIMNDKTSEAGLHSPRPHIWNDM